MDTCEYLSLSFFIALSIAQLLGVSKGEQFRQRSDLAVKSKVEDSESGPKRSGAIPQFPGKAPRNQVLFLFIWQEKTAKRRKNTVFYTEIA